MGVPIYLYLLTLMRLAILLAQLAPDEAARSDNMAKRTKPRSTPSSASVQPAAAVQVCLHK